MLLVSPRADDLLQAIPMKIKYRKYHIGCELKNIVFFGTETKFEWGLDGELHSEWCPARYREKSIIWFLRGYNFAWVHR